MSEPLRIAVLGNANARAGRRSRGARWRDLAAQGHVRITSREDQVASALADLLAAHPDVLICDGGDGTLRTLLRVALRAGWLDALPPLLVLPGGTVNMSAQDLSGVGSDRRARRAVPRLRAPVPLVHRSVLRITAGDGSLHAGTFLGVGAVVRGVQHWEEALRSRFSPGGVGVAIALARTSWGLIRAGGVLGEGATTLTVDALPKVERPMSALMVTTLHRVTLGLRPMWGGGDAPLAVTYMDDPPPAFARHARAVLWGDARAIPPRGYASVRGHVVTLAPAGPWLLDGEVIDAPGPLRIEASPPLSFVDLRSVAARSRRR